MGHQHDGRIGVSQVVGVAHLQASGLADSFNQALNIVMSEDTLSHKIKKAPHEGLLIPAK
jgi:hypothetical protein